MWVQLQSIQYVTENGKPVTHYPGDWVDVGKQTALLWIQRGDAAVPERGKYGDFELSAGSGILILSGEPETEDQPNPARKALEPFAEQVDIRVGARCLLWTKSMIWNPALDLRPDLVATGMMLLDSWQIAVPLGDYDQLASNTGSETERERTKAVTHDLRLPLYDTRLMFVRSCKETETLFERWEKEMAGGAERDERHAFLRALYRTPLLILALPTTWTNVNVR